MPQQQPSKVPGLGENTTHPQPIQPGKWCMVHSSTIHNAEECHIIIKCKERAAYSAQRGNPNQVGVITTLSRSRLIAKIKEAPIRAQNKETPLRSLNKCNFHTK